MNGGAGGAAGSDRVGQKKHKAVRSWGSLLRILLEGTLLERTLCPHPERCVPILDAAASSTRSAPSLARVGACDCALFGGFGASGSDARAFPVPNSRAAAAALKD